MATINTVFYTRARPHLPSLRLAERECRHERHPFPELHQVAQHERARSARARLAVHQARLPVSPSRVDVSESHLQYRRIHILNVVRGGGGKDCRWLVNCTFDRMSANAAAKSKREEEEGGITDWSLSQLEPRSGRCVCITTGNQEIRTQYRYCQNKRPARTLLLSVRTLSATSLRTV